MDTYLLLKGMIIGFSIAAPVGPIGLLCIQRTLNYGRKVGLATGFGAASADAVYGCLAGFGLTYISGFIINQKVWIGTVGGAFLCYLGIKTFLTKFLNNSGSVKGKGIFEAYVTTFFLTITNPMTVISFIGIYAGMGAVGNNPSYISAASMVAGVFVGSAIWWIILSTSTSLLHSRIYSKNMGLLNKVSGLIILGFGIKNLIGMLVL